MSLLTSFIPHVKHLWQIRGPGGVRGGNQYPEHDDSILVLSVDHKILQYGWSFPPV